MLLPFGVPGGGTLSLPRIAASEAKTARRPSGERKYTSDPIEATRSGGGGPVTHSVVQPSAPRRAQKPSSVVLIPLGSDPASGSSVAKHTLPPSGVVGPPPIR